MHLWEKARTGLACVEDLDYVKPGLSLLDWCETNNLSYVNSYFSHNRRGTWFNVALARWYELDGFLMENTERHLFVRKICTIGENSLSDHKPKKMKIQLVKRFEFRRKKTKFTPKICWEKLNDEETERRYRERVQEIIEENNIEEGDVLVNTTNWEDIASIVNKAAEEICGIEERQVENPWMAGKDEQISVCDESTNQWCSNTEK